MRATALALFLAALATSPLSAQVRGRVLDPDGRPVAEAVVELWNAGGRVTATVTNESGLFLIATELNPPLALLVRKIGFLPARVSATTASEIVVRLRPREVVLAALTVTASAIRCVTGDNRRARRMWEDAASRYSSAPYAEAAYPGGARQLLYSLRGTGRTSTGVVSPESLAILDTTSLRDYTMWRRGMDAPIRRASDYYAPSYTGLVRDRFDRYQYPLLDSYEAFHFADTLFGSWNRLGEPRPDNGGYAIEFCSRHRDSEPFITGVLYLSPDTTLASARWSFVTTSEVAGGAVWFAPRAADEPLPPLAALGLFWRRMIRDVFQQWTMYQQWYVCPVMDATCVEGRAIGRVQPPRRP